MSELIATSTQQSPVSFCGQCGLDVFPVDNFCRNCGTQCNEIRLVPVTVVTIVDPATKAVAESNDASQQVSNTMKTILNNRLYVIGIIALIGPLGLPAIWFSPRFSRSTKTILTVIYVLLTTVVPLAVAWYFLDYSLRPLVDAFRQ